jgi:hypothetical protein
LIKDFFKEMKNLFKVSLSSSVVKKSKRNVKTFSDLSTHQKLFTTKGK